MLASNRIIGGAANAANGVVVRSINIRQALPWRGSSAKRHKKWQTISMQWRAKQSKTSLLSKLSRQQLTCSVWQRAATKQSWRLPRRGMA